MAHCSLFTAQIAIVQCLALDLVGIVTHMNVYSPGCHRIMLITHAFVGVVCVSSACLLLGGCGNLLAVIVAT